MRPSRARHLAFAVVALAALLLQAPHVVHAASASLYLSPSSGSHTLNSTFNVSVFVSTDVSVNSAEATVSFPKDKLNVTSVSSAGIFTIWTSQPSYSNSTGRVAFAGGLPTPGYKGKTGKIITITFKAIAEGSAKVSITKGSVLANDGKGTNVLKTQGSGTYSISKPAPPVVPKNAPTVASDSQTDQTKWYSRRDISASWHAGTGVKGYAVVFDNKEDTVVAESVTTTASSFSQAGVSDGTWYLHVRAKYDEGWSQTTTFAYHIDATPPDPFTIEVLGDPQLNFEAKDATSGIDHYEISIDGSAFAAVASPYTTPSLDPGKHTVTVRAYDKAGNSREASVAFDVAGYPQPVVIDLTPVAIGNEPIVVRGFANAQDSIRLTIDGQDYGPYPVSAHLDEHPPSTAAEGQVAWKIEVRANVGAGEHEVTFTSIGPNGEVSSSTPALKFRIMTNAVRVFGTVVPMTLVVNILVLLILLAAGVAVFYAVRFHKLSRKIKRDKNPKHSGK